jgi:hypothetical protein
MARRKPWKPARQPARQVEVGAEPGIPTAGARSKRVVVVDEHPYALSTLVQCLRQYVEANPSRFTAREDRLDGLRIVTVILAQVKNQP